MAVEIATLTASHIAEYAAVPICFVATHRLVLDVVDADVRQDSLSRTSR
jgi:hypothetical protein